MALKGGALKDGVLKGVAARRVLSSLTMAAITLATITVVSNASAQAKETKGKDTSDGYGYEFDDDPLNAGGFGPNDATIRVRAKPMRTTLIRPRTSFIPEMLKSVENL